MGSKRRKTVERRERYQKGYVLDAALVDEVAIAAIHLKTPVYEFVADALKRRLAEVQQESSPR